MVANLSDIFVRIHYTLCNDCELVIASPLINDECVRCRTIRRKLFKPVIAHLDRFDFGAFENGAKQYKIRSPEPATTLEQFYNSTKFCWYASVINNGSVIQMLVHFAIIYEYFKFSKIKSLMLKLIRCGATCAVLIPDRYYLYKPRDLKWLIDHGAPIQVYHIHNILEMNADFEEILELLKYIYQKQPWENHMKNKVFLPLEETLSAFMYKSITLQNEKQLLEWTLEINPSI